MSLPEPLSLTLDRIVSAVSTDVRFDGIAVGGSVSSGAPDAFSDLDFVVVVADAHHSEVMRSRSAVAAGWGRLLAAFTGEHVGEPRLLICLYDEPLVHVDLKFVTATELDARIEDPRVLWERDGVITRRLAASAATPLAVDPQWIEDRFWVWVHYAATKLGRGELFETIDFLSFVRSAALAPLASLLRGLEPRGVRRAEVPGVPRGGGLSGPRRRDRDGVSHRAMVSENDQELTQKDDTARWLLTSLPSSSCSGN